MYIVPKKSQNQPQNYKKSINYAKNMYFFL